MTHAPSLPPVELEARSLPPASDALAGSWEFVSRRTRLGFLVFKLGLIPVPGRFRRLEGTLTWSPAGDVQAEATIAASSITTYLPPRDLHLRGRQFLDVRRHPAIRARTVSVDLAGDDDHLDAIIALEIKGRVGDVQLRGRRTLVEGGSLTLHLRGRLDRRDFGIRSLAGIGGILVGHRVRIRARLTYVPIGGTDR